MDTAPWVALLCVLAFCSSLGAQDENAWGNPKWRLRTTVTRATPWRDQAPRPVEVAIDFPLLLERAGISGEFDPGSVRILGRDGEAGREPIPAACRTEFDAEGGGERAYLTWMAQPKVGQVGAYDIYFDTKDRGIEPYDFAPDLLPPENLLVNPGFDEESAGVPVGWQVTPPALVTSGKFAHTTGARSLKVVVDEKTPPDAERNVVISQTIDVGKFAGQEMVFACDLFAERAPYGAPVCIELEQFRADGSRILEYAVESRWLTIELAQGQRVELSQRGRFSPEAATLTVRVRLRCVVLDADTGERLSGQESFFTVWLDRLVLRPGERWPWPPATDAAFVAGALEGAPLNRGFEFTGQRRVAFNGASEGTLTSGTYDTDPRSAHWGLVAGTLEFWCRPAWNADDGAEHVFFEATAIGHRLQSRLRKLGANGANALEFTIADADGEARTVRGPAPLRAGAWHHVAATWDFPAARLQLFVDGRLVAAQGPGATPWASSLTPLDETRQKGMGVTDEDRRSLPMQAFIGGDRGCRESRSAQAVLDEFRISDVVRYGGEFAAQREEFAVDEHTRALFHFENERHGVHDSGDRFVQGHLACELPPQEEGVSLEVASDGKVDGRMVQVKPYASAELFAANRAENRLTVTRPFRPLPDPRFVEYRERQVERVVKGEGEGFTLTVGGDLPPLMRSITWERAEKGKRGGASPATTLLPHWRANDNVVPLSVQTLAATLAPDAKSDAEKALAVFKYATEVTNYFNADYCETFPARHRPQVAYTLIKALNIYPFDQCGPLNHMLRKLFLAVGISSNDSLGTHHQFQEAFYQGSFRLFDLSPRRYWLARDNSTVASRRAFEDDLYLKLRQGSGVESALPGRLDHARFGTAERPHSMDFPLRPGERASICWQNEGRWFEVTGERERLPLAKIPPYYGNGAILYEPTDQGEAAEFENLTVGRAGGKSSALRPKDPARPASLVYRAHCPYIFSAALVTGEYEAQGVGALRLSLSFDEGKTWTEVWQSAEKAGSISAELQDQVAGRYAYWLKLDFASGQAAAVKALKVRSTFVASPLALPGRLSQGENRITFVGGEPVVPTRTVCRWVERYRSDLGVSLNSLSYYMNGDETHRNLFILPPGEATSVLVTLAGRRFKGEVSLDGLPEGWVADRSARRVEVADGAGSGVAKFVLRAPEAAPGETRGFDAVVREGKSARRMSAQVLVAEAPLVREAEHADDITGQAAVSELAEASGAQVVTFAGNGELAFDFSAEHQGTYALWLRARWEEERGARLALAVDGGTARDLRASALTGFIDWTDPKLAHTKMFAFFGEQFAHWSWYRIPDVELGQGTHRLTLSAGAGAQFDVLVLLPQNPTMDRAAMNLFQNWNFAPWQNPL